MAMTANTTHWIEATNAVEAAQSILVVTHISPDGDAIGSLMGLTKALRERNLNVDAAVDGGVPDFLSFIAGVDTVRDGALSGEWDLMISVDASDEVRTGEAGAFGRAHSKKVINLDHHTTNIFFGDIFLVDPQAVSATEVVFRWLEYMNHPISQQVAVALLAGLVTDTLGFRTSNVNTRTLAIAMRLMEAGASLTEITQRTLDSKSYSTIELWKQTFSSIALMGEVIEASVTQQDLKNARLPDMTDGGLVGLLISVSEAMVAVVFKELENGRIEISLRARPGYDVSKVAFGLGGGGHKQASGATIDGPLEAARARVLPLLHQAAREGALVIA